MRNGLILTVRAINHAEETAGAGRGSAGPLQPMAGGLRSPLLRHPFPLPLSRVDQCLTNNSTYFEIAAGNATLVKHGEQHRRARMSGLSPRPFFGGAEMRKGLMSMFYII